MDNDNEVAQAIEHVAEHLTTGDVEDNAGNPANIVDVVDSLAQSTNRVADAITPNICGNNDATGSHVASLTEAAMGITAAIVEYTSQTECNADTVAQSIDGLVGTLESTDVPDGNHHLITIVQVFGEITRGLYDAVKSIDGFANHFTSPNFPDRNMEAANIVDVIGNLSNGAFAIAKSIDGLAQAVREHRKE